jgi:hypothetical protein
LPLPLLVTGYGGLGLRQGAPKKKKKATYLPTYLFLRFFEIFRSDFRKYLYGVFGILMQRNGQKRDKKSMGKDGRFFFCFPQLFLQKYSLNSTGPPPAKAKLLKVHAD